MAPEVIKHAKYDERIDVFSFAIILWELLTSRLPYADMSSLAAAAGVVERGLRPPVPPDAPPAVADLMQRCWAAEATVRPPFTRICEELVAIRAALEAAGLVP
jgi:serine/threonine protein kinase